MQLCLGWLTSAKCRRNLPHANFGGCRNLTDAALLALANNCSGLTLADFGGCNNLTDVALLALADNYNCHNCHGLMHAAFSACENLTDNALLALAEKCKKCKGLRKGRFNFCGKLTDAALLALANRCRNLTHANFVGCENVTDAVKAADADLNHIRLLIIFLISAWAAATLARLLELRLARR